MSDTEQQLQAIYDEVPHVECKGLCHIHCTQWIATEGEFVRLTRITGESPHRDESGACCFLKNERCTAYEHRPYICRAYGVVEGIACPFGCKPERTLTQAESIGLIAKIYRLFGSAKCYTN